MESSRRRDILKKNGLDHSKERADIEKSVKQELERQQKVNQKRDKLLKNPMFKAMQSIRTGMDTFMLDPILGFILPEAGDIISAICALPFLYFALFKVKSVRLAAACLFNTLVDLLIGLIPIVGDFFDILHRSYKKNLDLIVGYVNDDRDAKHEVNVKSAWVWPLLLVFIGALYLAGRVIMNIWESFAK